MRSYFIAGVIGLGLFAFLGAASTGVGSAQTVSPFCQTVGLQATCQVLASTQLSPPDSVFVLPADPSSIPLACQGVSLPAYGTQGAVLPAPASLAPGGQPVCLFEVIAGSVSVGAYLGTETATNPSLAAGVPIQVTAYLCGDPSCANGALTPGGPSATVVKIGPDGTVYTPASNTASSASNATPGYDPAWNSTSNRCFHVAGSPDPCQQSSDGSGG
jgi:hypothetical protein